MSDPDLLKQIAELQARNGELLAENEKLRNMLGLPKKGTIIQEEQEEVQESDMLKQIDIEKNTIPSINKYSAPEEKIELVYHIL